VSVAAPLDAFRDAVSGHRRGRARLWHGASNAPLPRWPFTLMFVGFPIWWVLGPGEAAWIPLSFVMLFYLVRRRRIEIPNGFGLWLLFMVWMSCSVVEIDTGGRLIGFIYRGLSYLTATIIFLYVYNARENLTLRYVAGVLSAYWVVIVIGGYLGVFFPLLRIETPLGYVLPGSIRNNELVKEMITRRVTQFDPTAYDPLSPRPSAPFLYTNGWGNAYSMLSPFFVAYLAEVRHTKCFWFLAILLPVSLVPALLTLNRGMFIGVGIGLVYAGIRSALRGHVRALIVILAVGVLIAVAFTVLPISELLTTRLSTSSTTTDRANLYAETFTRTLQSPLFGYGAPRPSFTAGAPDAGTQGQVWMVLFSHGIPGLLFFMGWIGYAVVRSARQRSLIGFAGHIALLIVFIESFYYGTLLTGLAVAMIAGAITQRPAPKPFVEGVPAPDESALALRA